MQVFIDFENDVIERLSRTYYEELLYFSATVPTPLINFNDILLLKKGQKYVSHTNNLFQKSISTLFLNLFTSNDISASVVKTDGGKGRGVFLKKQKIRIHFLGQEKFVNFPRVEWFNFSQSNDGILDLYTVLIEKDDIGNRFVQLANDMLAQKEITSKKFILLEDYVISAFSKKVWELLKITLSRIETNAKQYQWFGLVRYYNRLSQDHYTEVALERLSQFDYAKVISAYPQNLRKQDFELLWNEYHNKQKYRLMLGDYDFARSFITSEWLFENLNISDNLEKTYIVTGYIKSIEQLLFYLIQHSASVTDQIGIAGTDGINFVDVLSNEFYRATLGNMQYYLRAYSSRHIYKRQLSNDAIKIISLIIHAWIQEERNGYFHKHNIQTQERVSEIRNKTFLLYFLIISAIEL